MHLHNGIVSLELLEVLIGKDIDIFREISRQHVCALVLVFRVLRWR